MSTKKTRAEYETIMAEWRGSGYSLAESRIDRDGGEPIMYATISRRCSFDDAPAVLAAMGVLCCRAGAYLSCHIWDGRADVYVAISRPLDEADGPVKVEPCDTVAEAAGVGGPG